MGSSVRTGKVTVGHPVDVATGTLFHEFDDFTQPGRFPLVFGRRYSTGLIDQAGGMFGQGWSSPFEMVLRRDLDGWRFKAEDGESEVTFEGEPAAGGALRSLGDFCELQPDGTDAANLATPAGAFSRKVTATGRRSSPRASQSRFSRLR